MVSGFAIASGLIQMGSAAEKALVDVSKLPPASTTEVDFLRDIQPILEASCLRCHGPQHPKGGYRIDSRESAIKGGEIGVAIVPGNGAGSPLVHYVARLVEKLEMPPAGKSEPLSQEQISLLRAWIDQGVAWSDSVSNRVEFSVTTTLRWTAVSGSAAKFRENNWRRQGWDGGIEQFELKEKLDANTDFTAKGRALRDDYQLDLKFERAELGFVRVGVEQSEKYFNDTGGFYPAFSAPAFSLGRDLHVESGRAWLDIGLTPVDWPKIVVGYEYQWQRGERATLEWGPVFENGVGRNIFPATKHINEQVHVVKLDVNHSVSGVDIRDSFRGEFYDLRTRRNNLSSLDLLNPAAATTYETRDRQRSFTGANTLLLDKQLNDWLFASGGYLYSRLSGDGSFGLDGVASAGSLWQQWRSRLITLDRESHVGNVNALLGPWSGLTASIGAEVEWTRQQGMTDGTVQYFPVFPGPPALTQPLTLNSDLDTRRVEELAALRFTAIPYTVLFGEARLRQESVGRFEQGIVPDPDYAGFVRQTDATGEGRDYRIGFSISPWTSSTLSAHYRRNEQTTHYDNPTDLAVGGGKLEGYPAYILGREILSDEVEVKLALKPFNWLRTTFGFQLQANDFRSTTDSENAFIGSPSGTISAGTYDANIYSFGAVFTGLRGLYLSSSFSYQSIRSLSAANGSLAVVPERGSIYSVAGSATYALSPKMDLLLGYAFSRADFAQANYVDGLPLGTSYEQHSLQAGLVRRIRPNLSMKLQYGFSIYNENNMGGLNDFQAHSVNSSLNWRLQ